MFKLLYNITFIDNQITEFGDFPSLMSVNFFRITL